MDFLKQAASAATGASAGKDHKKTESQSSSGGLGGLLSGALGKKEEKPQPSGGVSGFFNNALGGGAAGEKKEGKNVVAILYLPIPSYLFSKTHAFFLAHSFRYLG